MGASNLKNWSKYQGRLNWVDAKSKCVSIGMRLPTKDELKAACEAGARSWEERYIYWSSTPNNEDNKYVALDVHNGLFDFRSPTKHYFVRCIR